MSLVVWSRMKEKSPEPLYGQGTHGSLKENLPECLILITFVL